MRPPAPDVFAVVMATGIVSIAAGQFRDTAIVSIALGVLAVAEFVALLAWLVVAAARGAARWRPASVNAVFGAFTFVAACGVLVSRFGGSLWVSLVLGVIAASGWLVELAWLYGVVRPRTFAELRGQARGSWLLLAVATQSLSLIDARLLRQGVARPLIGVAVALWGAGVACYCAIAALIVARQAREPQWAERIPPDHWILMGGLAISVLAGDNLTRLGLPLGDAALVLWGLASFWLVALSALEVRSAWLARLRGDRLVIYESRRWATVFPLGMYSAATSGLGVALGQSGELRPWSMIMLAVALAVWCATCVGALRRVASPSAARSA